MFDFGSKTYVMGILNVTPDSFSDGGRYNALEKALARAEDMIHQGADIIDIGGESTRPGAPEISDSEEIARIEPVIKEYKKRGFTVPISLDTSKASVARVGLEAGADIINDVWGFQRDRDLPFIVAEACVPVILMHNSRNGRLKDDIIDDLKSFFDISISTAIKAGVKKDKIILDPGIGFGKSQEDNILILKRLDEIKKLGYPLLLGTSRKSFIGNILDLPPEERVEGTIATTVTGISMGVDIVRVHDVRENYRAVIIADKILRGING